MTHLEGEWQSSGGKIIKDGARSTLLLDKGPSKLLGIEGKNPYLPAPEPRAGETVIKNRGQETGARIQEERNCNPGNGSDMDRHGYGSDLQR